MSEVRVNKISPRSGTTVTLGDNGDTITIPSGVTLSTTSFSSTGIDDNATSTAITINSSEQVAFTDGTVSLPSITNLGDENTGIFFPSADTIAFSEGGTEAMRITSDGRLGIGTTTPTEKLSVDGSVIFNESGNNVDFRVEGDTDANLLFVDASTDRVGIGNSSPSFKLDVKDGDVAIRETDSSVGSGIRLINDVGTQIIFRGAGSTRTNPGATQGMPQLVSSAGYDLFIGADGNNNIPFTTNRSERMRLTSDGKLGIGTSSPTEVLHVVGDILATGGDFKSDANNYLGFSNNTFARFVINDSEKMRINSSGNVGIGTTTPQNKLDISAATWDDGILIKNTGSFTTAIIADANRTSADTGIFNLASKWNGKEVASILFNTGSDTTNKDDGVITFRTSSANNISERMRINQNGNIQIGTTAESARLHIASSTTAGTDALVVFSDASGTDCGSIDLNASGNTVAYTTSSDYRLKENVDYNFDATTRIKQLKPARFNFIADADTTVDGFIAHEVSSVVPEAVTGTYNEVKTWKEHEELPEGVSVGDNKLDENGNTIPEYQGIDQSKLVPLLVKTIQELEARITTLENA
jgi:hypothetical protein